MKQDEIPESTRVNKSQVKLEMEGYRLIAEKLAGIKLHLLDRMSLHEDLVAALLDAHRFANNKKAHRRQILFIAKIISQLDVNAIKVELEKMRKIGY